MTPAPKFEITAVWFTNRVRVWLAPMVGIVLLLLVWEIVARTIAAGKHIIPTLPNMVSTMVADNFYLVHVKTTIWEAGRGFFWGNLAAICVAGICLLVPPLKNILTRLAMATYSTPTIAIAPLLIVLFSADGAKVTMAGLSVFFPTLLGTLLGLDNSPKSALEFVRVSGGSQAFAVAHIRLRAAVPSIAAALSLAAPAAVVGAMIGEYLGGDRGLGVVMMTAQQSLNVERAWAVAVVATFLSTLVYLLIGAVANRVAYTDTTTEFSVSIAIKAGSLKLRALGGLRVIVGIGTVVLLWFSLVRGSGLDPFLAKTPDQVWSYLFGDIEAAAHRNLIFGALGKTLSDASVGYIVGTVVALLGAVVFLNSSLVEGMFLPLVMTVRAVPLVAMTPIIALVFGRGALTVAVLAGAVTLVPTLVIVLSALRAVPKPTTDLIHVYAVGWVRSLLSIRLVYAVPALAASARVAIPGSILGAVLVEILATGDGIGYIASTSIGNSEYLKLWSALTVLTGVTTLFYMLLSQVESMLLKRLAQ